MQRILLIILVMTFAQLSQAANESAAVTTASSPTKTKSAKSKKSKKKSHSKNEVAVAAKLLPAPLVRSAFDPIATSTANSGFSSGTTATSSSSLAALNSSSEHKYTNSLQIGSVFKKLNAATDGTGQNHDVSLDPNAPMGYSLGWSNKYLGISLVGNVSNGAQDQNKVHTSAEDYQFRYFNSRMGFEFVYQNYKGFNQKAINTGDSFINPQNRSLADLSMTMIQAQFDWAFYGVASLEAFGPTWEKPSNDGAAFYLTSSISQAEINNPTPFLPQTAEKSYGDDANLTNGKYQTLGAGFGGSYLWQWAHFYTAVFGSLQGALQSQHYKTTTVAYDNLNYVWLPQLKYALGCDWGNWYVNGIAHVSRVSVNLKDTSLNFLSYDAGVFLGSRF